MLLRTALQLYFVAICYVLLAQSKPTLEKGTVIDTVVCDHSEDQTYALYLPSKYDPGTSWPVIYFFEPIARGSLPVRLYQETAEELGYILVGSNNSRNGPLADGEIAYNAITQDTEKKLNIEANRIYTSGFSGGGRFSQYMAAFREEIDGVIAVAGPKSHRSEAFPVEEDDLLYVGIVGNKDMNFHEHVRYQQYLEQKSIGSHLVIYEAGHQWPPNSEYRKTMLWLDNMMKVRRGIEVEDYVRGRLIEIDSISEKRLFDAYRNYQQLSKNFKSPSNSRLFTGTDQFFAGQEKEIRKVSKANEKNLVFEREQQTAINLALVESEAYIINSTLLDSTVYTLDWWRKEVRSLKNKEAKGGIRGEISGRLLDYLRGFLHGVGQRGQGYNRQDLALFANEINLMIADKSPWFLWHHAIIYAKMDKENQSRKYLKKAFHANEEALNTIRHYPQFSSLKRSYPYLFE